MRATEVTRKDHPRVCGEKDISVSSSGLLPGSPPRMRGKAKEVAKALDKIGITPAYAGKSFARYLVLCTPRDHPRVCGEKAA